jgi:hypothetical protein
MGTPNSMRILYYTSFLIESQVFLKSINADVLSHCTLIFSPVSDECRKSDQ